MGVCPVLRPNMVQQGRLLLYVTTVPSVWASHGLCDPTVSSCSVETEEHSLLVSGLTAHGLDSSITMLTGDTECVPDIPPVPEARTNAGAILLGQTLMFCGGFNGDQYSNTCHSYRLGPGGEWETDSSMILEKEGFGMTAIGQAVYVTGGSAGSFRYSSVEVYTANTGWTMEDSMEMESSRHHHCSIALDQSLVVIGGYVDGHISSSVMSYNTGGETEGWVPLASLHTARYYHGCDSASYLGTEGVFVTGGESSNYNRISTVEFLDARTLTWTQLGPMKTARDNHSLSRINGRIIAAGGYDNGDWRLASIERMEGADWVSGGDLGVERERHTSVTVPAGLVSCK